MSSTTLLKHALVCASLAAVLPSAAAQDAPPTLSCMTDLSERAVLKKAPKNVRRVSKHVLEIGLANGKQRFTDEPPYDESAMDGVQWQYCGYDAQSKAHLVGMRDGGTFTGKLLLEESGKQLPAGHSAAFAPDGQRYAAVVQENGKEGGDWSMRDLTGKILWKGDGIITGKEGGESVVVSELEKPRWTAQGELTARYVCMASEASGTVTLVRAPSGKSSWRGHGKCQ